MLRKGRLVAIVLVATALVLFIVLWSVRPLLLAHAATRSVPTTRDAWYGAYLQGQKIGYMNESIKPVQRNGQTLYEYVSKNYAALDVMGQHMEQTSAWVSTCDAAFHPLDLQFTLESGGRATAVTATFTPEQIRCTKTSGDNTVQQTVDIPKGVTLVVDSQVLVNRLKPGEHLVVYQFNPVTFEIEQCKLTAGQREPLELEGRTVQALKVLIDSPMVQATGWVDPDGNLLKLASQMMNATLEFHREPQQQAMAGGTSGTGPRVDLVVATSIRPSTPIADPANAGRVVLKVKGLDRLKHVPSDAWQTVEPLPDGTARVTIDAGRVPAPAALKLPLTAGELKGVTLDELKAFLGPTPYIEADHPEVVAAAKQILNGETDVAKAIALLHDWVNQRIHWQSNIGLFRSGLEILRDPTGVCRDAAALYAALARAAGIPTRVCAGLVYVGNAFLGHAWCESWCGAWLPVDATTPGPYVNATHLKLSEGARYTSLFEILPALGALSIEVEQVTPRPAAGGAH